MTPWTATYQATRPSPSPRISPGSCLLNQRCHSTILFPVTLFSFCLSIRVFSNDLVVHIWWPKYWSFSFRISPSNEYSGLISVRIDWFDFIAVQGTLKSFLQYQNLKASILWCSTFFMVQLSHLYMTTEKSIALTTRTFVSRVMSAF